MQEAFYIAQRTKTNRTIFLTPDSQVRGKYRQAGQAWFLPFEIEKLRGMENSVALDHIIDIKELFDGEVTDNKVEEVNEVNQVNQNEKVLEKKETPEKDTEEKKQFKIRSLF